MSPKDLLTAFGEQVDFQVETEVDVIRATGVPCLIKNGSVSTCTIKKSYDQASGSPDSRLGGDIHGVCIIVDKEDDGLVYNADGTPIGNNIGGDGKTWSNISIKKGPKGSPENDRSALELLHRYAKQIVGAVSAAGCTEIAFLAKPGPFKIMNTFEARAALGPVQDRIREQRIAIIGLGGTGAYVLDLMAKTPVPEIHLLDSDHVEDHTFMRAPGAPNAEVISSLEGASLKKVRYLHSQYASFREGVHAHPVQIDCSSVLSKILSAHPIDFAFVCIDQKKDCESPRQDIVYESLSKAQIPFVDSGVSITLKGNKVRGAVTTSFYSEGSEMWRNGIPNAKVDGNLPGYRNVQLPEVNALAASLAVMEWRRRTEQYYSESSSFLHKFRLETPRIIKVEG